MRRYVTPPGDVAASIQLKLLEDRFVRRFEQKRHILVQIYAELIIWFCQIQVQVSAGACFGEALSFFGVWFDGFGPVGMSFYVD